MANLEWFLTDSNEVVAHVGDDIYEVVRIDIVNESHILKHFRIDISKHDHSKVIDGYYDSLSQIIGDENSMHDAFIYGSVIAEIIAEMEYERPIYSISYKDYEEVKRRVLDMCNVELDMYY